MMQIEGVENLPPANQPAVYVSNHQSFLVRYTTADSDMHEALPLSHLVYRQPHMSHSPHTYCAKSVRGSSNFCCTCCTGDFMCCSLSSMTTLLPGVSKQMQMAVVQDIFTLFHLNRSFKFVSKTSNFLIPIIGWSMFLTGQSRCCVHSHHTIRLPLHQRITLSVHILLLSVLL